MALDRIILKHGFEKPAKRRHPWIFSNAIARVAGDPQPGETVVVETGDGKGLGQGAYSPHSQIRVRFWTFDSWEDISPVFFYLRLKRAIMLRDMPHITRDCTAYRLVNAESDGLPGLIVDKYNDFLVCQFLGIGAEYWKDHIIAALNELVPNEGIYERSDSDVRKKEGLLPYKGIISGQCPPSNLIIQEGACKFVVDIETGHKTGFYLDQRENREYLTRFTYGKEVLNCFSYTGGFSIWALYGGAVRVINVEASGSLLDLADGNLVINGYRKGDVENEKGDVFVVLRKYCDSQRQFDIIVLDPPKFIKNRGQLLRASKGYKDINRLAFKLLRPGGLLFTFSCSELMPMELFQKIVADAALDAGCEAQIIKRLTQAADHPIALNFPEGAYLKGLVCRAVRQY